MSRVSQRIVELENSIGNLQSERRERTAAARNAAYTLAKLRLALADRSGPRVPDPHPELDVGQEDPLYRPPIIDRGFFDNDRQNLNTGQSRNMTTQKKEHDRLTSILQAEGARIGSNTPVETSNSRADSAEQEARAKKQLLLENQSFKYNYADEMRRMLAEGGWKKNEMQEMARNLQTKDMELRTERHDYYDAAARADEFASQSKELNVLYIAKLLSRHPHVTASELAAFSGGNPRWYEDSQRRRVGEQDPDLSSQTRWLEIRETQLPEEIDIGQQMGLTQSFVDNMIADILYRGWGEGPSHWELRNMDRVRQGLERRAMARSGQMRAGVQPPNAGNFQAQMGQAWGGGQPPNAGNFQAQMGQAWGGERAARLPAHSHGPQRGGDSSIQVLQGANGAGIPNEPCWVRQQSHGGDGSVPPPTPTRAELLSHEGGGL
jgi:hypothetical protein